MLHFLRISGIGAQSREGCEEAGTASQAAGSLTEHNSQFKSPVALASANCSQIAGATAKTSAQSHQHATALALGMAPRACTILNKLLLLLLALMLISVRLPRSWIAESKGSGSGQCAHVEVPAGMPWGCVNWYVRHPREPLKPLIFDCGWSLLARLSFFFVKSSRASRLH